MGVYKCNGSGSIDYYRVLRISRLADRLEIKSGYKAAALECHPGKNDHCLRAKERMHLINHARDVLTYPQMKQKYDALRSQHSARRCECKPWMEEADIWTSRTGKVAGGSGDGCHCGICDPGTKARKEKERKEEEEAMRQELIRQEVAHKQEEQRAKALKERLKREAIERKRLQEIERKRKIRESLEAEHESRQKTGKARLQ